MNIVFLPLPKLYVFCFIPTYLKSLAILDLYKTASAILLRCELDAIHH